MAFKLWIAQGNIRRYRRLLDGQSDPQERAAIETLLAAEEATLAAAETAEEELRRRIKRYREKAEELTTVANQCETEEARAQFKRAAETYDVMADAVETCLRRKRPTSTRGTA